MSSPKNDIKLVIPLAACVNGAAMEMYEDLSKVERRYYYFGAAVLEDVNNQTLKSGKRRAFFTVNKRFNTINIDCDFIQELFIGVINKQGERVPFHRNWRLIDTENIETIPDDVECEEKCTGCFSKALCNDLQTTETIRLVDINGTDYEETRTMTLQPDGNYIAIISTPYYNNITSEVEYLTKKKIITTLDLEPCGCVQSTPENVDKIRDCNYDCYCTWCSPVCCDYEEVGYRVFPETSTIKFDSNFHGDKVYMEWRGSLPKRNGEYVVPFLAKRYIIESIKFMAIQNKKNVTMWERREQERYRAAARSDMEKVMSQDTLHNIMYALMTVPKFDYHS